MHCLSCCQSQCQATAIKSSTVHQLWALSNACSCRALSVTDSKGSDNLSLTSADNVSIDGAPPQQFDYKIFAQLIDTVLGLFLALLPWMTAPVSAFTPLGSASLNQSRDYGNSRDAHSHAAAASRAASVLQQRKLAKQATEAVMHDPFPISVLFMLAGALQVVEELLCCLANKKNPLMNNTLAASNAAKFIQEGKLLEHLYSALCFLLRCVRRRLPSPQPRPAADPYPAFEEVLRATCQNACIASTHVFSALCMYDGPNKKHVPGSVPACFVEVLGCLACEGLTEDDTAAGQVAMLFHNSGVKELTNKRPCGLLCCDAMQQLIRRTTPSAAVRRKSMSFVLDVLTSSHPQLYEDPLLSVYMGTSSAWVSKDIRSSLLADNDPSFESAMGNVGNGAVNTLVSPCVRDESLQQLLALLSGQGSLSPKHDATRGASTSCVFTARITAVLLSLHLPKLQAAAVLERARRGAGNALQKHLSQSVQHTLTAVACYSMAVAKKLLQGMKLGHAECECKLEETYVMEENQQSDPLFDCGPCYALAGAMTAMLLHLLPVYHLHDSQELNATIDGELKHCSPMLILATTIQQSMTTFSEM